MLAGDRHANELRSTWQAKALVASSGPVRALMMSVLAHTLDDALLTLCTVCFPDFDGSIKAPHYTSAAKIDRTGAIVADMVDKKGRINKDVVVFGSEIAMRDAFRRFADRLKLDDADRIELFKYAQRWVVADRRLDPNMDPRDPDARRLN